MFDRPEPRPPPAELIRGLAVLAEPPTEEHPRLVEALGLGAPPSPSEYADVFLFQLYPYASVHLGPEGMMGGEARGRVAGFWRALGYEPPAEPDHLAALLGLYSALVEGASGDVDGAEPPPTGSRAERRLYAESSRALLREHLAPWVFLYLERLQELTKGTYAQWARILGSVLGEQYRAEFGTNTDAPGGAGPLPLHLRSAPSLPDPRESGAKDFVSGLLAPVRSGVLVVRADIAAIASACDLGLRAGERRYALEHLLAQDGAKVLEALAVEAGRQANLHEERLGWLGDVAAFMTGRARSTEALLHVLAAEERTRDGATEGVAS